jgi:hypothetical protein
VETGLQDWRLSTNWELLRVGTMPLPVDVQTLPLYLWEQWTGTPLDPVGDLHAILFWCRATTLLFWWLLLWYARLIGRSLAGPWAGRLALALLACEPNLLAHASLATTDIAVTACLLALFFHYRSGRDAGWVLRLALPALWYGLAILAKASALVYGPICLAVIEIERLARAGVLACPAGTPWRPRLAHAWRQMRGSRRDLLWIGCGGLALTFLYCGCDFKPQPSFVDWAHSLPEGPMATVMVWVSEHLCIFNNAGVGIVRQIKHNMHGHGAFLLGASSPRALWYYFPVLLTIKLALPLLLAPLGVAAVRARALTNWACLAALVLLLATVNFRVQIGIRLVLPLVAIGGVGVAAAAVEALRMARWHWIRQALTGALTLGILWMTVSAVQIWPNGLCYINECWGGPDRGYELVSDSNYDWGQGLGELAAWRAQHGNAAVDVWYFGSDPAIRTLPLHYLALHTLPLTSPADVMPQLQGDFFAASMTMVYGHASNEEAHRIVAEFLQACPPVARTTTFLIYNRRDLAARAKR